MTGTGRQYKNFRFKGQSRGLVCEEMSGGVSALVKVAALSKSVRESGKNVNGLLELIQYLQVNIQGGKQLS